jgi:hypothetical protein
MVLPYSLVFVGAHLDEPVVKSITLEDEGTAASATSEGRDTKTLVGFVSFVILCAQKNPYESFSPTIFT